MFRKGQEKRMKNYNAKTAIKYLAEKPRKTQGLSMPYVYTVHGNNKPKFHASDEKQEMMLKKERTSYDLRIKKK